MRMRSSRRRRITKHFLLFCFLCICFCPFLLLPLVPVRPPSSFSAHPMQPNPATILPSLCLTPYEFDIIGSHRTCFTRLQGVCFSSSQVTICKNLSPNNSTKLPVITPSRACSYYLTEQCDVPSIMRFYGERLTLPVVQSSACTNLERRWISGLQMVADQRFLPHRKPNPHHEAEKLIPALFMQQIVKTVTNTSLYWFSKQHEISKWATGFLSATHMDKFVKLLELPKPRESPVCFEDAVIFSPPTNLWYIPSNSHHQWVRDQVLQYCSIPSYNASSSRSIRTVTILDRDGIKRHIANKEQVASTVSRILNVTVKQAIGGVGSFCEQVQAVVDEDLLIVPHGSQNTNLIFARPGTVVIEVFPYLYYTDAFRNLTNAAGLQVYAILGQRPKSFLMWLFSLAGWDLCFSYFRWCRNYSRQLPVIVDINQLEKILFHVGRASHAS